MNKYGTTALTVYNQCPSAYEAVRDLHILQLACTKMLKKILKDGAENPGIDHSYLESQQKKFKAYQRQRESIGHPQPLGIGVLMWDEVKVREEILITICYLSHFKLRLCVHALYFSQKFTTH